MKANVIKSLKNNAELVDIEAGRSARRNFPGVDFENAVLIINGKIATPDTIIQNKDIVTLRQFPGDITETPWWIATFLIPFGFIIQPIEIAIKAKQQAEEAAKKLSTAIVLPSLDPDGKFARVVDGLVDAGYECVYPEGAFYLFVKSPIDDDVEFCARAKAHNILVVPGKSFACPGYVRIAYCVSHETIMNSIPAFAELMKEIKEEDKE